MLRLKSLYSRWLECDWGGAQDDRRQRPRRACQDQHLPVIGSAGWALKSGLEDSNSKMASTPRGLAILRDPQFNKSTAFTESEREALGLLGLLPEGIDSEAAQIRREHLQLSQKPNDLEKYIYLSQLQDTDETLFFCVLMSAPVQFLPLAYSRRGGRTCLKCGHIMPRPRGLYPTIRRKARPREIRRNWPQRGVCFIVV